MSSTQLENHPLDRKTFIVRQDADYVINRVITQGEDVQRTTQTVKTDTMTGFVSEGMKIVKLPLSKLRIECEIGLEHLMQQGHCLFINFLLSYRYALQ